MRVFLDENLPSSLARHLPRHEVSFVEREGWKGAKNGALLALVEQSFDVLVTADTGLPFQNVLAWHELSLVVLPTNLFPVLKRNAAGLQTTLNEIEGYRRHCIIRISWDGRRRRRWLDEVGALDVEIAPISPFERVRSRAKARRP